MVKRRRRNWDSDASAFLFTESPLILIGGLKIFAKCLISFVQDFCFGGPSLLGKKRRRRNLFCLIFLPV